MSNQTLFFIDIDGTIADASRRFKKAGKEPKKRGKSYTSWLKRVQNPKSLKEDAPVKGMVDLINCLPNSRLVYLTSRSEAYRGLTSEWLKEKGFKEGNALIMRPLKNVSTAGALKEWLIDIELSSYLWNPPVFVIDDDYTGELEEICKRRGWTFLKARTGTYE